jgi:xanthine dehydrogenase iron-sulfur cluster and FAD-binding subunit A
MKVVGIGKHKGRCYEYLPIMTVPREEATSILHDDKFDTLQLDEDYAIRELENLQEKVKEGFTVESKKHSFNLPSISSENISLIVSSLSEMKNEIKNRVVKLD